MKGRLDVARRNFCNDLLLISTVFQVRAGGQIWAVGKSFAKNADLIARGA